MSPLGCQFYCLLTFSPPNCFSLKPHLSTYLLHFSYPHFIQKSTTPPTALWSKLHYLWPGLCQESLIWCACFCSCQTRSTPNKVLSPFSHLFTSLLYSKDESYSEWKPQSLQSPTGLTQSDFLFPFTLTPFLLLLCSFHHSQTSLFAFLKHIHTLPPPSFCKCVSLCLNALLPEGAQITLSLLSSLGLKCHLFQEVFPGYL